MSSVQLIPLKALAASPLNARKTDRTAAVDELAAPIEAHGLLRGLTVVAMDDGRFQVAVVEPPPPSPQGETGHVRWRPAPRPTKAADLARDRRRGLGLKIELRRHHPPARRRSVGEPLDQIGERRARPSVSSRGVLE